MLLFGSTGSSSRSASSVGLALVSLATLALFATAAMAQQEPDPATPRPGESGAAADPASSDGGKDEAAGESGAGKRQGKATAGSPATTDGKGDGDTRSTGELILRGLRLSIVFVPLLLALFFAVRFVAEVREGPPSIETHWGGFGGGLGGWSMSKSMAYLILAIAMSGVFVVVALEAFDKSDPGRQVQNGAPQTDKNGDGE